MIPSVVPHDNGVGPPVPVLGVKGFNHLAHKESHCFFVGVRLEKAGIDLTQAVERNDECDPRVDLLCWDAVRGPFLLPAATSVVPRVEPGLVDADQALLAL